MGLKPDQLSPVLHVLGFRVIPAAALGEKYYGPPAPPMLGRRRLEPRPDAPAARPKPGGARPQARPAKQAAPKPVEKPVEVPADSPFAALAALRRVVR
jgi:ATP-dependent RNA helicase SUPV3L1/SUV3